MQDMKIITEKEPKRKQAVYRLDVDIIDKLNKLATKNRVPREKLVEAILRKCLNDPKFEVKV